jgi:hypothetical protein
VKIEDVKEGMTLRPAVGADVWNHGLVRVVEIEPGVKYYGIHAAAISDPQVIGCFSADELEPIIDLDLSRVPFSECPRFLLPEDAAERKKYPIATGVLDYFPAALLEISKVSYYGNLQHNPGQPLHHARGKSTDQVDAAFRHYLESRQSTDNNETFQLTKDKNGVYVMAQACWRMLAEFQIALEQEGRPLAGGAKLPKEEKK